MHIENRGTNHLVDELNRRVGIDCSSILDAYSANKGLTEVLRNFNCDDIAAIINVLRDKSYLGLIEDKFEAQHASSLREDLESFLNSLHEV